MQEHINTALMHECFARAKGCAFCQLARAVDDDIANRFLGEAVMVDEVRAEVGKKGFCNHHATLMHAKSGKLGLALQLETRFSVLRESVTKAKNAKKAVSELLAATKTCIACELAEKTMARYAKETAIAYRQSPASVIGSAVEKGGFCLSHFALLASENGKDKGFLTALMRAQDLTYEKEAAALHRYCLQYDCKHQGEDFSDVKTAPQDGVNLL